MGLPTMCVECFEIAPAVAPDYLWDEHRIGKVGAICLGSGRAGLPIAMTHVGVVPTRSIVTARV